MITSLRLVDFKNFADETLRVGPFTVIVGANASGKSNIRDAFRFLHGIGRGYALAEILGGKYGAGGQVEWSPIRGVPNEISRLQQAEDYYGFSLSVGMRHGQKKLSYSIGVKRDAQDFGGFRTHEEDLKEDNSTIFTSHPDTPDPVRAQGDDTHLLLRMGKVQGKKKYGDRLSVRPNQPALTQIGEHGRVRRSHKESAAHVIDTLANMRFLDLAPDRMRQPAFPGQIVLGDSGENLSTVLRKICADPQRKANLIDWTRELTPMDVQAFEFPVDNVTGLVQLVICESGQRKLSAYSISDGTLRFLAMLAALLSEDPARLYFFEEIENGLHPSRLRLLLDLIERQTAKSRIQVLTTTHSPDLLSMVSDETFRSISVTCRLEDSDDAIVRPVADLPKVERLRKDRGLGRLLARGWMEDALAFTEGSDGNDKK